jgi:site-specific recombinase XerD
MKGTTLLAPWVRRFLLEHLVGERNLSRNTQQSYRDTLRLLLPFVARYVRRPIEGLAIEDVSADVVRAFLRHLEEKRGCAAATRNQRLAAIRSLSHFIGLRCPEHVEWCASVRCVPFKRTARPLVTYLEKPEMDALLAAPARTTAQGRRDHAVLLFLYNTGARAGELAQVQVGDLDLGHTVGRDPSSVLIRGKGNKLRRCPLWASTVSELRPLIAERSPADHVFRNRRGEPLTRFGVHALVERHASAVAGSGKKRISPHTIRHTTATHLLRAGVDINTIRAWLGHVSLSTTNIYAEVDLEMKAMALAKCEVRPGQRRVPWRQDVGLMEFLQKL